MTGPQILEIRDTDFTVRCSCGVKYDTPLPEGDCEYVEQFGQYTNISTDPCPECSFHHTFNMNIPEVEEDEQEVMEEEFFPPGEKENREKVRELMFKKRPDLKGKDRAKLAKEKRDKLEKKYGLPIDKIRENNKRVAEVKVEGKGPKKGRVKI